MSVLGLLMFDHSHFNGITEEEDNEMHNALINRVYFASTTISSVGYGDISPKSKTLKLYVSVMHLIIIFGSMHFVLKAVEN